MISSTSSSSENELTDLPLTHDKSNTRKVELRKKTLLKYSISLLSVP